MRIPDQLIYLGIILAVLGVSNAWHDTSNAPPAPPQPGVGEMALFANFSPFAEASIINLPVDDQKVMTGTAFSVSQTGEWIVGRKSIEGCTHPFLNIGGNLGVPFTVRNIPGIDTYVVVQTDGGGRPLPLADPATVKPGIRGFMPGFPGGEPGEATARLIGKTIIERTTRFDQNQTVLAWAEAGRTEGIKGDLSQLLGAPVIDDTSHVIGIVIAEDPRRGRIYTSDPETLAKLANPPDRKPDFESEDTLTRRNYGIVADTLRREYRVAQVGCVKS